MNSYPCLIQTHAKTSGQQPAIICGHRTLTYHELNTVIASTAKYLEDFGVGPKNRVAIFYPNSIEYLVILLACWRLQAIGCLLNPRLPKQVVIDQLEHTECQFLLTSAKTLLDSKRISAKKINLNHFKNQKLIENQEDAKGLIEFSFDQEFSILFTSGSTDSPKAVMHTFGNHFYSAKGSNEHIPFTAQDRWCLTLPLYHVGGLSILFRAFLAGGAIVLPNGKSSLDQTLIDKRVTHLSLVSTQMYRLMQDNNAVESLKKLKAILVGGGIIPEALIHQSLKYHLPVYLTYGLTEMSSQVATSLKISQSAPVPQAKVLNYSEVSISDDGEILVKGKTLFKGYVLGPNTYLPQNDKGWFPTGDLGFLTNNVYLEVTGRKDYMFISGGENIHPEEIERLLCDYEGIDQAVIIPVKHQEFGFRPVAFIKPTAGSTIPRQEIFDYLNVHLPKYKIPDQFFIWPVPLEDTDVKIDRNRLKQLVQSKNFNIQTLV